MLKKSIPLILSLVLTSSLVAGCGRANFDTLPNNQVSAMSDVAITDGQKLTNPDSSIQLTEEEIILNNELSPEINDYDGSEIINLAETNSFPFLLDETTPFSTQSLKSIAQSIKSILTLEGVRNKIKAWRQKSALKKVEKFEIFSQQNPALAKELPVVANLKGSAKRAKVTELKTKYPTAFDKLTKKIAVSRWIKFEKKNPGLSNDLMDLSQLSGDARTSRLEQLKLKYPKFFKVKVAKN